VLKDNGKRAQESAEAIVVPLDRDEGPNCTWKERTDDVRETEGIEGRAEKSERPPRSSPPEVGGSGRGMPRQPRAEEQPIPETDRLMEQVVENQNLRKAYARVRANAGAAGIDQMTVEGLRTHLQTQWAEIRKELLEGAYQPDPVRRVEIPKPDGGKRLLGVPTVLDRFIQQALMQVLGPIFEGSFSEHSYGFRPGRNAHQAVRQAQEYQKAGKRWVVDIDLKQFFDEVHHDILMSRVSRKVQDARVLRLIRRYLRSGVIMIGGMVSATTKGTPQGGPLSPLLANILLDEMDKELEGRGHAFCRYADDCNIYVATRRSGERVMASITRFLQYRLKLKVNSEKSAVARPWERKFLGFSFTWHLEARIRVAPKTVQRFREQLKELFRQGQGRNQGRFVKETLNPVLRGWINYFGLSEVKNFAEELDPWIRRRLRAILWRQWKRPRTRRQRLQGQKLAEERATISAYNGRGPWWNAGASHMNEAFPKKHFDHLGLVSLLDELKRQSQRTMYGTAGCGTACPVV
jgi:RNA-directed DNA polymerase